MNKTKIKNFAVWARKKLREEIRTRAGFVGITEGEIAKPLPASTAEIKYFEVGSAQPVLLTGKELREREKLVRLLEQRTEEKEGDYKAVYGQMIENYAYDWFNRLIAIRFMEVNGYFTDNLRVLSATEDGGKDPDIVSLPFSSDLEFSEKEREKILEWKMNGKSDSLFRFLLLKRCNQLHECLPGIFEEEGDASELMMHFSFIDKDGIIYHLVHDIEEEDWKEQVQIIGWIYQYYNSELKDETFALAKKGKKITKERIPSATQLFTPDWIVRYMVENSLGRIWLEGHPDDALKSGWKYYLEEAEQEPDVQNQLEEIRKEYRMLTPEELTFIDPCMGSGHILVYAFDVLMQIYEAQGYTKRDAVQSILRNNLYGLDIDDRAYQLAYFSIMMKAREYDARILERGIVPQVYAIQESNGINRKQLVYFGEGLNEIEKDRALNQISFLLETFIDAKELGSVLNIEQLDWDLLNKFILSVSNPLQFRLETIGIDECQSNLEQLVDIGKVLGRKYLITCTNPPYMVVANGGNKLNEYVRKTYTNSKTDMFAVFIEKCMDMTENKGFQAMITQHAWMFIESYEKLRGKISLIDTVSMIHLGARAFDEIAGEVVQTTSFVFRKSDLQQYRGTYCRLVKPSSEYEKEMMYLSKINRYITTKNNFSKIPGSPISYWLNSAGYDDFANNLLEKYIDCKSGIMAGDDTYVKLWYEVNIKKINFNCMRYEDMGEYTWFPLNSGGTYRKWYGNNSKIIDLWHDGFRIRNNVKNYRLRDHHYYFKRGLTWGRIASSEIAFRDVYEGSLFGDAGPVAFVEENRQYYLAFLNSKVAGYFLEALNPTMNFQVHDISNLPMIMEKNKVQEIIELALENISIARRDWDLFECSWDYSRCPLVKYNSLLCTIYKDVKQKINNSFKRLKNNEEYINALFIEEYGLGKILNKEINNDEITIHYVFDDKTQISEDMKRSSYVITKRDLVISLISYAVGCMFGRYSLDEAGLIYAGYNWNIERFSTYIPDADNVIPITDMHYLDDDIVEMFIKWVTVVYGEDTLEENLDFIAKALGTKGTDSRDIIRNYFLKDFFNDHCTMYSVTGSGKRPIYWLFDSGKQNGFKALIYMHRYNADTIGRVRASYLHQIQEKYENEVRAIDAMILHMIDQRQIAAEEKRKEKLLRQIAEVKEYDEKLDHLAAEKIEIDLDDGVRVNYEKVQTDRDGVKYQILAPIK